MTTEITTYHATTGALGSFASNEGQRRMIALADEFRSICQEREKSGKKWLVPIGSGRHAIIEAWQYLGQRAGIVARTAETRELRNPVTGEYEGAHAVAEAQRLDTGEIVGRAEQVCYADEVLQRKDGSVYRRWDGPDGRPQRHAIIGMAQSRAQSRALASVLRFLAEMAGVEGTPAEEMDGVRPGGPDTRPPVEHPARASESQPTPPVASGGGPVAVTVRASDVLTGRDPAREVPASAGADSVSGFVEDMDEKSGIKNGKAWKRYGIKVGGTWYGTFDKNLVDFAREEAAAGREIIVVFGIDVKGYRNIVEIMPA